MMAKTDAISEFISALDTPMSENGTVTNSPNFMKLGYVMEPGKITLSFSRLETARSCLRKFQLKELKNRRAQFTTIDMAYGSAFGAGVQELFLSGDLDMAKLQASLAWDFPEFEDPWGKKKDKSFGMCLWALELFAQSEFAVLSQEYELAYFGDRNGIELFVYLDIGERYSYQVHVDLVLQHKDSGALCVAEIKTSGMAQQEANWGNADQTMGYYSLLWYLCQKYERPFDPVVFYITHHTGKQLDPESNFGFVTFPYMKDEKVILDFMRTLMVDIDLLDTCQEMNYFPKRGSACVSYNRPCEFYGTCDLETNEYGGEDTIYQHLSMEDVDFVIDINKMLSEVEKSLN